MKKRPPQSALTRSTDVPFDPTPMLDRPGGHLAAHANPRTALPSSLQKIRLSSDSANPLNGSRNQRADGDGCVGLLMRRRRLKGVTVGRSVGGEHRKDH